MDCGLHPQGLIHSSRVHIFTMNTADSLGNPVFPLKSRYFLLNDP